MSDVPRSLQSWVLTFQSVVLTADAFQHVQRFTAVGTLLYFFLCYYFHVVYSTVLLKLHYSVTRSVLFITCRLCSTVAHIKCHTVRSVKRTRYVPSGSTVVLLPYLQRHVTQCLRVIMCCLHAVCCTVIFLYCSVDGLLYTVFHV